MATETIHRPTCDEVWQALERSSFAVVSHVTPGGEPRSSGIVFGVHERHLYLAVAPDSWKARQIPDGGEVAVTVPVRRGGALSLVVPIPPATISVHARAIVHRAGSFDPQSFPQKLRRLLPAGRESAEVLELVPEGAFMTYGIGVSLAKLANPTFAKAHVSVR
jgi:hypothetical protein